MGGFLLDGMEAWTSHTPNPAREMSRVGCELSTQTWLSHGSHQIRDSVAAHVPFIQDVLSLIFPSAKMFLQKLRAAIGVDKMSSKPNPQTEQAPLYFRVLVTAKGSEM